MTTISIFGHGNMGTAIGGLFEDAGHTVSHIGRETHADQLGEIVVLAVPYTSIADIIKEYKEELKGKVIVEISNPLNSETLELAAPADSSMAQEVAHQLPDASVIKAFNTTFAATLKEKKVSGTHPTVVMMASDDDDAKKKLAGALEGSGVDTLDTGSLGRARDLEALGHLQLVLAIEGKLPWTGGFGIFK